MLNEQTLEKLHALKLNGMADAFREQLQQPACDASELCRAVRPARRSPVGLEGKCPHEALSAGRQAQAPGLRRGHRLPDSPRDRSLRADGACLLRLGASSSQRPGHRPHGRGQDLHRLRPGTQGLPGRLPRPLPPMPPALPAALPRTADGSYGKLLARLAKVQVLVLDDLGLAPMNDSDRRDLLEVIEDRHGSASTLVTSQLPIEHWHDNIGDPTLADAILDRLIHNAHKITLKGASMRKTRRP